MCVCIYLIAHTSGSVILVILPRGGSMCMCLLVVGGGAALEPSLFCFVVVVIYIHIYFPVEDETIHSSTKTFSK